ncbi:glycosyltransferase 87 family protein [uncultured Friedmanniella sp.]|uniref:glycosyltransferase 87 family protein n=1 Tax=uncultured Friedmanniella sp. TaxID=335381 RepID=UPI0035CA8865
MSAHAPAPTRPGAGLPRRLSAWYDQRRSGRTLVLGWLGTRVAMLVILALAERFVVGDVFYYHRKIHALFSVGLPATLNEYPTPVTWLLWLPYGVTGGNRTGYLAAFVVFMLLLDGLFTVALWRSSGRRHTWSCDFWLLFVFLIGPLSYLRFDILPAVLAGGALLAARRRPWVTGALTGLGAAVKLWPALLIGPFLAHRQTRRPVAWSFVAVGFGLAAISLVLGGWARLVSPLTWQSDRGLQVESTWATPVMLARALKPSGWTVDLSRYQAYEVFGPGVGPLLTLSTIATVLGLAAIAALVVRAHRHPAPSAVGVGVAVLATVAIMTITNKTLSPQYLLWLGGAMAALLLLSSDDDPVDHRVVRRLGSQLLVLALLTHLVYPLFYDAFLGQHGHAGIVVSTLITAARNVFLVIFTARACRLAWRRLARPA